MINRIKTWLIGDLSSILGLFNRLDRKLQRFVDHHEQRAQELKAAQRALQLELEYTTQGVNRAKATQTRIQELTGA